MAYCVAGAVEAGLDEIWLYVAKKESGSMEVATRLVDRITDRFVVLATSPYIGRVRDDNFQRVAQFHRGRICDRLLRRRGGRVRSSRGSWEAGPRRPV